jgi:hypothetical protein
MKLSESIGLQFMPTRLLLEVTNLLSPLVETLFPSRAIHELGMRGFGASRSNKKRPSRRESKISTETRSQPDCRIRVKGLREKDHLFGHGRSFVSLSRLPLLKKGWS